MKEFYFQWHFTDNCNLRCKHCYQQDYATEDLPFSDLLKIAATIEQTLKTWKRLGRISLTGGEPFLHPKTLFTLLNFFEKSPHTSWVGILTNGTLISDECIQQLQAITKLREVQISLDGATEITHNRNRGDGVFALALKALDSLKSAGITSAVMCTLTKENIGEALNMVDLALDHGVSAITFERCLPLGEGSRHDIAPTAQEVRDVFMQLARIKKNLGENAPLKIRTSRPLWGLTNPDFGGYCPVGVSSLCIMHNAEILPCRRLEIPIGNVLSEGIYKAWYTAPLLWEIRKKNKLDFACGSCSLLSKCSGCRAAAYAWSGDYLGKDPHCWKKEGGIND